MSWRVFVPGRLEVFGKHTDYAGGHSLVAALPLGMTVTAERGDSGVVTVTDTRSGESAAFSTRGDGPADRWRRYPQTVIRRLAANFPDADLSAVISISSDLPKAAGMSSSSALVIAVAEALIATARIEATSAWQAAIRTLEDRASYFGCIENGSSFKSLDGNAGVGTHGGSEDHAAILMSRDRHLQQFAFAPLRSQRLVKMPGGWTFAIASSGVHARKTGDVRDDYNRLADPARMAGARLEQFEAENGRVIAAADAFAREDIDALADLAAASQRDADLLLGNQVPETRDLVSIALARGAGAASSFGAGWGGSVWALVGEADARAFAGEWIDAYRRRYPHRASAAFIAPPSAGVILPG